MSSQANVAWYHGGGIVLELAVVDDARHVPLPTRARVSVNHCQVHIIRANLAQFRLVPKRKPETRTPHPSTLVLKA